MKKYLLALLLSFSVICQAQVMMQAHAGPDTVVCIGDSVQIGDNPIASFYSPPITSINWTPNTNINNNSIAQPWVSPSTPTWYYLRVTDFNGRSAIDSVFVSPFNPPTVRMNYIPTACLNGAPFTLTQGQPSGGYYKGQAITGQKTFDPFIAQKGYNQIWYIYQDSHCSYEDSVLDSVLVSWPFLSFMELKTGSDSSICKGDTGQIIVFMNAHRYTWNPSARLTTNVQGDSAKLWPDSTTRYWVTYYDTAGCHDSSLVRLKVNDCETGLPGIHDASWRLYPNPARQYINLEYTEAIFYRIISMEGAVVASGQVDKDVNKINLQFLAPGKYVFEIFSRNGEVGRRKFFRSH